MFGKSKTCAICGYQTNALTRVTVEDGVICGDCMKKCCEHLSHPKTRTVESIRKNIEYCEKNKLASAYFKDTEHFGLLHVDADHKIWYIEDTRKKELRNPLIFQFSQFKSYSVIEDGETIQKSGAGRAVAGGLLFGGIGMVAGGLSGRKTQEVVNKMGINVQIDSEWVDNIEITLITSETKKGSMIYNLAKKNVKGYTDLLDKILPKNAGNVSNAPVSTADELIKYKSLMDSGAISKEEFEAVKKKLLGI